MGAVYPRPYSDAHITQRAIEADPRFKDEEPLDTELAASAWLSLWKPSVHMGEIAHVPEKGTWLWTPLLQITPAYRRSILQGAREHGIRAVYLSLDSYLDIHAMPEGPEKHAKKAAFDHALETFITEAGAYGMSVDVEAGWRNWAEKGHTYKPFAVLDYAIAFNRTHEEKLRGFQYDVEPYLLERYQEEKASVLRSFLTLIHKSVSRLDGSDLSFSVVVPEFYDDAGETPKFFYAWRNAHAFDHLLRILERRQGSSVIVMSYRNFAEGENGAIDISKYEIERANAYNTKIVVAQETGDFPPPYITFYSKTRDDFEGQLEAIENAFAHEKSYGGIAAHYINTLMELK